MDHVLILIAAPGSEAIDAEVVHEVSEVTGAAPSWLAHGEALEVALPHSLSVTDLSGLLKTRPIDLAVVPAVNRRKRLLLADMDSTMIGQECLDELGALAGVGERTRAITARAMAGELDFEGALKERVRLMKGLAHGMIGQIIRDRITFTAGSRTLIATMKAHGAYAALVSGGFVQFTGHVAHELGFDEHRANELLTEGQVLSGYVREPILGQDAKAQALHEISARLGLTAQDVLAVGDGANDIPMLAGAGLGVAFHAKPKVQDAVPVRVNHGDLTALLYLQGYARAEFVG